MTRAAIPSIKLKVPGLLILCLLTGLAAAGVSPTPASASHGNWVGDGHRGFGWYVGDFDGDGDDDIFRQLNESGGAEVYLSNGRNQFEPFSQWTAADNRGFGWQVGDFNGDGADDLLRLLNQNGGAEVFLSEAPQGRNRFVFAGQWTGAGHRGRWYVGDFNGDFADDLFRQVNQYGGAEVLLSTVVNGSRAFVPAGQWTGDGHRGFGWYVGDFNGDDKDDIFRQQNEWGGAEVYLSNGVNAFVADGTWSGSGHRGLGWYVGDFDGNGSDDIFRQQNEWGGAEVFLSSSSNHQFICHGCGEDGSYWSGAGHRGYGWILGDFDGDGRRGNPVLGAIKEIDIFRQQNEWGGAEMFLSNGVNRFDCAQCGEGLLPGTYTGTLTGPDGSAPATVVLAQTDALVTGTITLAGPLQLDPGILCGGAQTIPTGSVLGPVTGTETSPGETTGAFQQQFAFITINGTVTMSLDPSGHTLTMNMELEITDPCRNRTLTGTFTRP